MVKKISQEEAKGYLRDANQEVVFWASNGAVIKNVEELPGVIKSMPEGQFTHHVNKEKNDFRNWIFDIIGDKELAKSISKVKTKETLLKKINARLKVLKKVAG